MIKVNSYEEIAKLISLQIRKGVVTNCFIKEEELKVEIENHQLYYIVFPNGLLIFRDRGSHYILNYYINGDVGFSLNDVEKDVVIEIVYRDNDKNGKELVTFFENLGMKVYLERVRLTRKLECAKDASLEVTKCKLEDAEDILLLLKENFDLYSGCIPSKEMILKDIENQKIYVYKKEKIEGLLRFDKSKMSSTIKHLAVRKEFRNKKIAQNLIRKYHEDVKGVPMIVWTGKENKAAIALYEKMGYQIDNFKSMVLMKKKGE